MLPRGSMLNGCGGGAKPISPRGGQKATQGGWKGSCENSSTRVVHKTLDNL